MNRRIKLITFDLDDTLWAVGPVIIAAEKSMWAWLHENCPAMSAKFNREALMPIRETVIAADPDIAHDISSLRVAILTKAMQASGYSLTDASDHAQAAFDVFMHGRHDIEYFEHVHAMLQELRGTYRLGVISNGNADVRRLSIGEYFDFAIAAGDLRTSKPDPRMFEAALSAGQVAPTEMVHVGDHHEHDIAGAQALGIRTLWINPGREPFPGSQPADAEVASLDELPQAIANLG